MRTITIVIAFLYCFTSKAQEMGNAVYGKHIITAQEQFNNDLKNNSIKVYTLGGLTSPDRVADNKFKQKYGVLYYDFGCVAPLNINHYNKYNFFVFNYLTEKYGEEWHKDIKDIAIGYYNWRKIN